MNKKISVAILGIIIVSVLFVVLGSTDHSLKTENLTSKDQISDSKNQIPLRNDLLFENSTNQMNQTVIPLSKSDSIIDFSYVESNSLLQSSLALKNISVSNPLKISGGSLTKYCNFYNDLEMQNSIEYCTSTELKDSTGMFLGNIHMIGTLDSPKTVLGIIQSDPLMSNLDSVKTTYEVMVESLVCNCWQEKKPGGLESISAWIDASKSHHLDGKKTTSHSQINGLAQKQILLEITTNSDGYLWKFIITN
jgi:hypothetical protein